MLDIDVIAPQFLRLVDKHPPLDCSPVRELRAYLVDSTGTLEPYSVLHTSAPVAAD